MVAATLFFELTFVSLPLGVLSCPCIEFVKNSTYLCFPNEILLSGGSISM